MRLSYSALVWIQIRLAAPLRCILWPISSCDSAEFISLLSLPYPVPALRRIGNSNRFQVANRQLFPNLVREGLPTIRDLGVLNSVSAAAFGLTSQCFLYIIEYILSNREAHWLVLRAKASEMRSSMPRPACLRSGVLQLRRHQRYQSRPASPRELSLPTSIPKMI